MPTVGIGISVVAAIPAEAEAELALTLEPISEGGHVVTVVVEPAPVATGVGDCVIYTVVVPTEPDA